MFYNKSLCFIIFKDFGDVKKIMLKDFVFNKNLVQVSSKFTDDKKFI